jgi:hypothetical protein
LRLTYFVHGNVQQLIREIKTVYAKKISTAFNSWLQGYEITTCHHELELNFDLQPVVTCPLTGVSSMQVVRCRLTVWLSAHISSNHAVDNPISFNRFMLINAAVVHV